MKNRKQVRSEFLEELDQVMQEGILIYGENEEAVVAYAQSQEDRLVSKMTPGERMVARRLHFPKTRITRC
jgi:hypothetical protein